MSKVTIQTLTAIHIGSGNTLQYGSDFVKGKDADGYNTYGIIDPNKILKLIGQEHIGNWVAAIERHDSTDKIVKQFAPNAKLQDYSKRILSDYCDYSAKASDTMKEFIHDGLGNPYIPGSSIKGAIRTAVLASLTKQKTNLESKLVDKRNRATAKFVESMLFGADPNSDIFRFLQVGDAIFNDAETWAMRMVNINERTSKSFWDTSKPQIIETLSIDATSEIQLKLSNEYYKFTMSHWPKNANELGSLPIELESLPSLFSLINAHTNSLVKDEIEYWEEREADTDAKQLGTYISNMEAILEEVQHCKDGKECILRIGHGSGWRFITGAWTEDLKNFDSVVVPASRPRNERYQDYCFPKTRRVDDDCNLLGFVKLSIV